MSYFNKEIKKPPLEDFFMSTKTARMKYVLSLLLFGSNGIVASYISLDSYVIVFWRTLIGSAFLVVLFLFMGGASEKPRAWENRRHFAYIIISGAAMGMSWMFLYEAYAQIGVSISTLAYYCGPVIVMCLSPLVLRERLTVVKVLAFVPVLAGMFMVNRNGLGVERGSLGLICAAASAFMYAFMVVFNKRAKSITGLENSVYQLSVSFLTVAIFAFIKQGTVALNTKDLMPVLFLGFVNTGFGCYLYFSSLGALSALSVAIVGYLEPLSALSFSAIFLHERLSFLQVIGAVLILGSACVGEIFGNRTHT
jgi:drug/metabolite transporter (DMT)-like permease